MTKRYRILQRGLSKLVVKIFVATPFLSVVELSPSAPLAQTQAPTQAETPAASPPKTPPGCHWSGGQLFCDEFKGHFDASFCSTGPTYVLCNGTKLSPERFNELKNAT